MIDDLSLFRAIPEPRGCGDREPGGCYVESGFGPSWGSSLEWFMIDPPLRIPSGLDLINKPQILPRMSDNVQQEDETGKPIFDLYIHIGAAHYPFAPDYIEETHRLGASRRLSANLDLTRLTRASRMILAHPKGFAENWATLQPPARCKKSQQGHDQLSLARHTNVSLPPSPHTGPCLFKLWELIPAQQAESTQELEGQPPLCLRKIGSTVYSYAPTGEHVTAWAEAFVLALPLTGFSLIQYQGGGVNEQAKQKLQDAQEKHGKMSLPFYESPR